MNKVFKKVFNAARGMMMVVNETTSSVQTGKKAAVTVAVMGALAAGSAMATEINANTHSIKGDAGWTAEDTVTINTSDTGYYGVFGYTGDVYVKDLTINSQSGGLNLQAQPKAPATDLTINAENLTVNSKKYSAFYNGDANSGSTLTLNVADTLDVDAAQIAVTGVDKNVVVNAGRVEATLTGTGILSYGSVEMTADAIDIASSKYASYTVSNGSVTLNAKEGDLTITGDILQYSSGKTSLQGNNVAVNGKTWATDGAFEVNATKATLQAIYGENESKITLDADTVSVHAESGNAVELIQSDLGVKADKAVFATESDDYAIDAKNGSTATIDAGVIEASSAYVGVIARSSSVTLGNDDTTSVKIEAKGQGYNGKLLGLWAYDPDSSITVKGEKLEIAVQGDEEASGIGILAQARVDADGKGGNRVIVDSQNTAIVADSVGISAMSKGRVDVNGNLTITAPEAILARGESTVNINTVGGKTVVLNGDVNFNKGADSGTNAWADVNLVLDTADSVWNGTVKATWDVPATAEDFTGSKLNLTLANGAQWNPVAVESVGELQQAAPAMFRMVRSSATGGQMGLDIGKLQLDDGVINLPDGVEVGVGELDGTGTLNIGVGEDGTTGAGLNVGQATEGSALDVTLMNADLTKELTSDDINADQAATILGAVDGIETTATVKEGFENGEISVGADGTTKVTANTFMTNALDLATAAPLAINRLLMNDVRKRLGDLRSAEGTHGVWARYDGGRLSGAMGLENDFHTLQAGIDTVPTADAARFGVALSYTKSDADMKRGGAEMDAFGLAVYGTKFYDNGLFVDVIGRLAKADTDLTIDGKVKGSMDNLAVSLSGEAGWRFNMTERHYVEPQVEVTYTRVDNGSLQLDNGKTYEFDSVDSVIGRAGFAAGFTCPNKMGDVYVRASVVREFMGDAGIAVRNGKPIEVNGSDTWFEYGIGANFNVNKNTYVYADIERTTGAALDEDWRANVGVRYSF